MISTIKIIEKENFSKWFKVLFCVAFIFYITSWLFTIYLSGIQKSSNLEPILPVMSEDGEEYRSLTESILSGTGFSQNGEIDTLRSPGYPSFLAFSKYVTGSYFTATLLQIFLVFFSDIIIRRLDKLFYINKSKNEGGKRVGEIAASLFLLNPVVWSLSLLIMTDILFLFLFLFGFYLVVSNPLHRSRVITASIVFTLAIYVRPMGVFVIPIFVALFLITNTTWKDKIKYFTIMIFIILVAVSPWVYCNYRITGVADFSSFKAWNLSAYAVPLFLANKNHTGQAEEIINIEKSINIPLSKWRDLRYSKEVSNIAEKIILDQPFSYIKYHIMASLPFLFSSPISQALGTYKSAMHISDEFKPSAINYLTSHEWKLFLKSVTADWWKFAERVIWLIIYVVAILGIWIERKRLTTWVFVFIPAYLMILAGPVANARYAVQALPFILIIFSVGVVWLGDRLIKKYNTLFGKVGN